MIGAWSFAKDMHKKRRDPPLNPVEMSEPIIYVTIVNRLKEYTILLRKDFFSITVRLS